MLKEDKIQPQIKDQEPNKNCCITHLAHVWHWCCCLYYHQRSHLCSYTYLPANYNFDSPIVFIHSTFIVNASIATYRNFVRLTNTTTKQNKIHSTLPQYGVVRLWSKKDFLNCSSRCLSKKSVISYLLLTLC